MYLNSILSRYNIKKPQAAFDISNVADYIYTDEQLMLFEEIRIVLDT